MRPSAPLYDLLADSYDEHFTAPHRRAYDELAWEIATTLLGPSPATVVDVGCGVGRWAERLVAAGHHVIGIEPSPAMAARAATRLAGTTFTLVRATVEDAHLARTPHPAASAPPTGAGRSAAEPGAGSDGGSGGGSSAGSRGGSGGESSAGSRGGSGGESGAGSSGGSGEGAVLPAEGADLVLAMGSLQYASDPVAAIARCAGWLRPGGALCVLVDSRQALVTELLAADRPDEALERLTTKRGVWRLGEHAAELHLLDAAELAAAVRAAGLRVERVAGLLVGATVHGRAGLTARLAADYTAALATERRLAAEPALADLGKQLLVTGRKPER